MKRFFHKSIGVLLFSSAVSLVLTLGTALARALNRMSNGDFNDGRGIIVVGAAISFLLLLNTIDIIEFWLRGKLQELRVKHIVGIGRANTYFPLYLNLNLLILIGYVVGVVLTVGMAALMKTVFEFKLTAVDCLLSFGFCVLFLNLFCTLLVPRALRKCGAVKA